MSDERDTHSSIEKTSNRQDELIRKALSRFLPEKGDVYSIIIRNRRTPRFSSTFFVYIRNEDKRKYYWVWNRQSNLQYEPLSSVTMSRRALAA